MPLVPFCGLVFPLSVPSSMPTMPDHPRLSFADPASANGHRMIRALHAPSGLLPLSRLLHRPPQKTPEEHKNTL